MVSRKKMIVGSRSFLAIYQRSDWFINNVNVDTVRKLFGLVLIFDFQLEISDEMKTECKEAIKHFEKSYALTWKTIRVLCYLEILESLRPNIEEKVTGILEKYCYMIHHDGGQYKVVQKVWTFQISEVNEMDNLNRVVDLFIIKYRGGDQPESKMILLTEFHKNIYSFDSHWVGILERQNERNENKRKGT